MGSHLKQNASSISTGGVFITSLTITYFHTGCSTIIGAKSFHGPVRDGKGWFQLAMVVRHNLSVACVIVELIDANNPIWKEVAVLHILAGVIAVNRSAYASTLVYN